MSAEDTQSSSLTGEGAEAESHHRSPITQSGGDRAGDSLSRCPHASCHPGPPNPRHKPCPELRAWPWARWAWSSQPNCCYFLSDELQTASLPTSNRLQGVPLSPSQLTHVHKVPQPQRQPMLTLGLCARGAWSELETQAPARFQQTIRVCSSPGRSAWPDSFALVTGGGLGRALIPVGGRDEGDRSEFKCRRIHEASQHDSG